MTEETTTIPREQQLMEEFKAGLDKDGPIVLAQRIAELEADNKRLNEELDLSEEEGASTDDEIKRLTEERDAAIARADAAEKASTAKVTKAATPARLRKLGDVTGFVDDEKGTAAKKLRAAIDDADEVQIAFSDGTREVPGIAPIDVAGDAWRDHQFGLVLREPVDIEGPGNGSSVSIDGYALILDGKQVAYARRSTPLQISPGQRMQLRDDIIF